MLQWVLGCPYPLSRVYPWLLLGRRAFPSKHFSELLFYTPSSVSLSRQHVPGGQCLLLFCPLLDLQDPLGPGVLPRHSAAAVTTWRPQHSCFVWISQDCPRITALLRAGVPPPPHADRSAHWAQVLQRPSLDFLFSFPVQSPCLYSMLWEFYLYCIFWDEYQSQE